MTCEHVAVNSLMSINTRILRCAGLTVLSGNLVDGVGARCTVAMASSDIA